VHGRDAGWRRVRCRWRRDRRRGRGWMPAGRPTGGDQLGGKSVLRAAELRQRPLLGSWPPWRAGRRNVRGSRCLRRARRRVSLHAAVRAGLDRCGPDQRRRQSHLRPAPRRQRRLLGSEPHGSARQRGLHGAGPFRLPSLRTWRHVRRRIAACARAGPDGCTGDQRRQWSHLRPPPGRQGLVLGGKPCRAARRWHDREPRRTDPRGRPDRRGRGEGRERAHVRASPRWKRGVLGPERQRSDRRRHIRRLPEPGPAQAGSYRRR
jgi:hypothetical protein